MTIRNLTPHTVTLLVGDRRCGGFLFHDPGKDPGRRHLDAPATDQQRHGVRGEVPDGHEPAPPVSCGLNPCARWVFGSRLAPSNRAET